jgi:hypothetical protein
MDALPVLEQVATLLERHGLEAVLIGNAAAALQGAPVTTIDLDFLFRRTPANMRKLVTITKELDAVLWKPHYPPLKFLRIARDEDLLKINFIDAQPIDAPLKAARLARIGDACILVKRFSRGSRQFAVALPDAPPEPPFTPSAPTRMRRLEALKKESELAERDQIRRWQALPIEKRTNFLRKRVGLRASCI